ncbi:MAG: hypothetical protein IJ087_00185 [Eggerthellaceae bacterium]|nr:hypothetical protein [Eggerthellaceae bacterium]
MTTELLNKPAYTIDADNLMLAVGYPVLNRSIIVTNPQVALVRGMAVINASGTLYVAGAESENTTIAGDIVAIIAADHDADTTNATVVVDAYVSGAFNVGEVKTINSLDVSTDAYVLGAQGNGIYLL